MTLIPRLADGKTGVICLEGFQAINGTYVAHFENDVVTVKYARTDEYTTPLVFLSTISAYRQLIHILMELSYEVLFRVDALPVIDRTGLDAPWVNKAFRQQVDVIDAFIGLLLKGDTQDNLHNIAIALKNVGKIINFHLFDERFMDE